MSDTANAALPYEQSRTEGGDGGEERMERIRALLFGSQMRDIERRLAELAERQRGETERLREEQSTRLARLEGFLQTEIERIVTRQQQDRQERLAAHAELADRLVALERDLSSGRDGLEARLTSETLALRGELRDHAQEQLAALSRSHRELSEALDRERLRLQDEKTGREELAQLFTELALRLNREFELPEA